MSSPNCSSPKGTVYLIHLDEKMSHSQHYIGWSSKLKKRFWHHRNGTGSLFLAEAVRRGINFDIVRKWKKTDKNFERRLKNRKKARLICPVCRAAEGKTPLESSRKTKKGRGTSDEGKGQRISNSEFTRPSSLIPYPSRKEVSVNV